MKPNEWKSGRTNARGGESPQYKEEKMKNEIAVKNWLVSDFCYWWESELFFHFVESIEPPKAQESCKVEPTGVIDGVEDFYIYE